MSRSSRPFNSKILSRGVRRNVSAGALKERVALFERQNVANPDGMPSSAFVYTGETRGEIVSFRNPEENLVDFDDETRTDTILRVRFRPTLASVEAAILNGSRHFDVVAVHEDLSRNRNRYAFLYLKENQALQLSTP